MSAISTALKQAREIHFLVEIDFDGLEKRYAMSDISVPYSAGDSKLFEGIILNRLTVGTTFSLTAQKYSISNVLITIANTARLQDEETRRRLDQGTGKIYIWCDGLDWADIETDGLIFSGAVKVEKYDCQKFSFRLEEQSKSKLRRLPRTTINEDTWPNHRTEGGGGSVAGLPCPLLFGDWDKGVPLKCVDTAGFKYLAHDGFSKSTDADYTGAVENVYDKDGGVIAPANYTFYPDGTDSQGNVVAYFDFTADQVANEPLSCSIRGNPDGSGDYTGTAGDLIEHLAHIARYLLDQQLAMADVDIDVQSIKTMESLLPGMKFATLINSGVQGVDLIDRILGQGQCARIPRPGGIGVMTLDVDALPVFRLIERHSSMAQPIFSRTPEVLLCNDLKVFYALNPATGKYEGELHLDRSNNDSCKKSYHQYGERPQLELKLPDVQQEATARACADRYLSRHAFRHDLATLPVPYWDGLDVIEGDGGLLTLEDGPSQDGAGWTEEPCVLLDRKFQESTILQRWWRVSTD